MQNMGILLARTSGCSLCKHADVLNAEPFGKDRLKRTDVQVKTMYYGWL